MRRTPKNPKKPFYGKFCRALCGTKEGAKGCANLMPPAKGCAKAVSGLFWGVGFGAKAPAKAPLFVCGCGAGV